MHKSCHFSAQNSLTASCHTQRRVPPVLISIDFYFQRGSRFCGAWSLYSLEGFLRDIIQNYVWAWICIYNEKTNHNRLKIFPTQGSWVVQSVKQLTLDLGSDHDLAVHGIEPCIRLCTDSVEMISLSTLLLCCSPTRACSLSLFQNK